jgi:hypothetical protein
MVQYCYFSWQNLYIYRVHIKAQLLVASGCEQLVFLGLVDGVGVGVLRHRAVIPHVILLVHVEPVT